MTSAPAPPELDLPDVEEDPNAPPIAMDPIAQWQTAQTPENLTSAVDALHPRLAYQLHRYGLGADPLAEGHARILAAKALKSYDPAAGASFHTWLDRNMIQLGRFKRMRATAIKVPEKIQLDNLKISRAQIDFEDEHGREPELDELAELAGMPLKRLHHVRTAFKKMSGEVAFEGNLAGAQDTDYLPEALEAVWDESDKLDRRILEMRIGFGGKHTPMLPKDVAARLNISPVALSRRSARIGAKLDEILEGLEK